MADDFTAPRRLTRDENRQRTVSRLLDAGITVIADKGASATTITEVCDAAGYTRGAFHGNFDSRDEFFDAVEERIVGMLAPALSEILTARGSVRARLAQYTRTFLGFTGSHPEETLALISLLRARSEGNPAAYTARATPAAGALATLLEEGQEQGEIRLMNAAVMAAFVQGALDTAAQSIALGMTGAGLDEVIAEYVDAVDNATRNHLGPAADTVSGLLESRARARAAEADIDEALVPIGMSFEDYATLAPLLDGPASRAELARGASLAQSEVVRRMAPMQKIGWVARDADARFRLAPGGRALMDSAAELIGHVIRPRPPEAGSS